LFGSLRIEIQLILKNFWPHRSNAKGFSIENLASKYRLKISNSNSKVSSDENSNQLLDDRNLISINEEVKKNSMANLSIKKIHWANRDFSEYKEAA
tara:strand:- start:49 stop:336 length:288 start_codon:yes stop_codon:yes gene_type:complete